MDAVLDLRAMAVLVAASLLFTALGPAVYRRDPARRRVFIGAAAVVLLVAPWWSYAGLWTLPVGMRHPGGWLAQPLPWLLAAVWWLVGAALASRTLLRAAAGRRALQALPPLCDARIDAECADIAGAATANDAFLRRPLTVKLGPSPCASSLGARLLVLPDVARRWPADTLRSVLAHELAHLKRGDDRVLLLVRLLTDWYWWMPWLKRLRQRYLEAMEESCDDLASDALRDRRRYVGGLMHAVRSLQAGDGRVAARPAWVALLGHSHLAARVERLLEVPHPRLDHADGRWMLLGAGVVVTLLLTARPAAIPPGLPAGAELLPLNTVAAAPAEPGQIHTRVESRSYLQNADGAWHALPATARDPLPVYPAAALAQGLQGTVTVEAELRPGGAGAPRIGAPRLSSSDPSGVLVAAVERALARSGGADLAAGLRAVSAHYNDVVTPPPGSRLRLRKTYRFVLRTTEGAQPHATQEVEP